MHRKRKSIYPSKIFYQRSIQNFKFNIASVHSKRFKQSDHDRMRSGKFLVSKGVHKVYYTAQSTPHADCPKCGLAVELPVIAVGEDQKMNENHKVQNIGSGV
jgi:hypothetical protein